MKLIGQVLNASSEKRELSSKDGTKRTSNIVHVLMSHKDNDGSVEILNIRSYDPEWSLPEVGKNWTTPRVKRYECFDGQVADITV